MYFRLTALALSSTLTIALGATSAHDIIARSVESEQGNRRRMVNYLFLEEINRKAFDRKGRQVSETVQAHEVLFIEGRPAFRRTRIDGRPLTADEEQAETARLRQLAEDRRQNPQAPSGAEERRRAHPFQRFLDLHDFELSGEETMDGRECWLIDSTPRRKTKPRDNDDRRIAESTARFWIDKKTLHRVRMDVTALKPSGPGHVRESTSYRWAPRDGTVWLITSIQTVLPLSGKNNDYAWYEGQQTYSRYRRFLSQSTITGVEEADVEPGPSANTTRD
jgi:hypothetical protein